VEARDAEAAGSVLRRRRFPSLQRPLIGSLGFFGGFTGNAANFVVRALAPTFSFIVALRDGGPHAIGLAVRPRSGRVTDSGSVVGPIRVEI
jgi:hypothetical protein